MKPEFSPLFRIVMFYRDDDIVELQKFSRVAGCLCETKMAVVVAVYGHVSDGKSPKFKGRIADIVLKKIIIHHCFQVGIDSSLQVFVFFFLPVSPAGQLPFDVFRNYSWSSVPS
jgi:hypothetical protein